MLLSLYSLCTWKLIKLKLRTMEGTQKVDQHGAMYYIFLSHSNVVKSLAVRPLQMIK